MTSGETTTVVSGEENELRIILPYYGTLAPQPKHRTKLTSGGRSWYSYDTLETQIKRVDILTSLLFWTTDPGSTLHLLPYVLPRV